MYADFEDITTTVEGPETNAKRKRRRSTYLVVSVMQLKS